jgi:hypothetical protein
VALDYKPGTPEVQVYSVKHLDSLIQREKYLFRLVVRDVSNNHDVVLTVRPKGFFANWNEYSKMSDFGYDMLSHVLSEWHGKYNATVYCLDPHWSAHEIAQEILEWGT